MLTGGSAGTPPSLDQCAGVTPVSFYFPDDDGGGGWVSGIATKERVEGKPHTSTQQPHHREI